MSTLSMFPSLDRRSSPPARKRQGFFAHHGVWAPGVRLFRRLAFRDKAILISLIFLIPIATLAVIYFSQSAKVLQAKERAEIGIAYDSEVLSLIKLLQQQRHLAIAQGEAGEAAKVVAQQFKRLLELDGQHGALLATQNQLQVLRANMDKAAQAASGNLLALHKRHGQSIEAAFALLDSVGDASGLSTAPDADSSHLIQTGLGELARLSEAALASTDLAFAVAKGANAQASARMLAPQRAVAVYLDARIRKSLDVVVAMHPEMSRLAYAATQESVGKLDEAVGGLGDEGWKVEPLSLGTTREALVERAGALQQAIVAELRGLEQSRVDVVVYQRSLLLALLAVTMLLAAYLFISFAIVMQGGLSEVRRHLLAMTDGDLTTSPHPWGKDEAAALMGDLRDMQESLREIVGQVRSSAEGIVNASQHIAGGAGELSSRTELTAASLQRSAAALEEIGSTVNQTAVDASRAAGIGKQSVEAATRGGAVMERVSATMHEIRTSSSKIGEIIGVIDGIAFQTNILALNAAVEAARAGESGRGFAVVATEVRSLAQRSAAAAREIKTLVSTSIETVNGGVGVVRDASAAMSDIATAAQGVNGLIDGIARATAEQARGVTDIGTSVTKADAATQGNTRLVEDTVAATATLESQAHLLAERVARFKLL